MQQKQKKSLAVWSCSLGCPKNRVDSEHLLGSLGLSVKSVAQMHQARMVFINTCGFIGPAVQESVRTVVEAVERVSQYKRKPLLVVAGCMVGRYGVEALRAELPEVDLWLPTKEHAQWAMRVRYALGLQADPNVTSSLNEGRLLSTGPSYAWLKVGEGCRHNCAFCTIPSIRGGLVSTPAEKLVAEAKVLLDQGVKELVLVAQDLTSWGSDFARKKDLRTLLDVLLPLPGLRWLRLLYLYPTGVTDDLLCYMRGAGPTLLPYLDIPLQHAHPDILSRMGRPFAKDPAKVLDKVRQYLPNAAIRTTFIVGYPGESEAQFEYLCRFVEEQQFANMGVFAYQAEEGTTAANLPDQIELIVKERRKNLLMQLQADISECWLAGQVGKILPVLVDSVNPEWPGLHNGRVWFQAPEVDGLTYISGPDVNLGQMVDGEIVEHATYDLTALA